MPLPLLDLKAVNIPFCILKGKKKYLDDGFRIGIPCLNIVYEDIRPVIKWVNSIGKTVIIFPKIFYICINSIF
ncbi:MAG: hypothetical protein D3924_11065 [Candidatus Electrothrix sp. AR4]|nr:hypothetical protein [Candidatus Electrothrix sp. AR4]